MRRFVSVLILAIGLSGCADSDWSYVTGDPAKPVAAPPAPSPTASTASANYAGFAAGESRDANKCAEVAEQRAQDAAYQGFSNDVQAEVHDRTYAACIARKAESAAP